MILCEACFNELGPFAEKCCCHGVGRCTCTRCGAVRVPAKPLGPRAPADPPYWHCIDGADAVDLALLARDPLVLTAIEA